MKFLTMSKYIISIFICLIFNYSFSQEEQEEVIEDSLKIEEKYGIRIGLDLSKYPFIVILELRKDYSSLLKLVMMIKKYSMKILTLTSKEAI